MLTIAACTAARRHRRARHRPLRRTRWNPPSHPADRSRRSSTSRRRCSGTTKAIAAIGASAYRFELDDPNRAPDLSALVPPRLRRRRRPPPTLRAQPDHHPRPPVAHRHHPERRLAGRHNPHRPPRSGLARPGELPDWARPRTGNVNGRSGGLLWTLADIDLLTPGPLAGDLRVAATGVIYSNGVITPVLHVDAKLAAARLAHPDVFFAPHIAPGNGDITTVASHQGRPTPDSHHRRLAQHRRLRRRRPPRRDPPRHPRLGRRRRHPPSPRLALRTHPTTSHLHPRRHRRRRPPRRRSHAQPDDHHPHASNPERHRAPAVRALEPTPAPCRCWLCELQATTAVGDGRRWATPVAASGQITMATNTARSQTTRQRRHTPKARMAIEGARRPTQTSANPAAEAP